LKTLSERSKGILIYDETSADWMICAQGAMSQNVCVATAYATLGMDAVVKAVKQGAVTALVCNRKVDRFPSTCFWFRNQQH
jgi:long-chain acyl-CoA synthetase